jgi:hypothetical protein
MSSGAKRQKRRLLIIGGKHPAFGDDCPGNQDQLIYTGGRSLHLMSVGVIKSTESLHLISDRCVKVAKTGTGTGPCNTHSLVPYRLARCCRAFSVVRGDSSLPTMVERLAASRSRFGCRYPAVLAVIRCPCLQRPGPFWPGTPGCPPALDRSLIPLPDDHPHHQEYHALGYQRLFLHPSPRRAILRSPCSTPFDSS